VDLTEPGQHMYFGVIPLPAGLSVALRSVEPATAGTPVAGDPTVTVSCRSDPNRTVLDVTATVAAITQALTSSGQTVSSLSPSGLGLQLLQPPPSQTFTTAVAAAAVRADSSQATP
jgi:acetylornithine deacetylase/succinyl-diaminopimelate desuccinylase-like protein